MDKQAIVRNIEIITGIHLPYHEGEFRTAVPINQVQEYLWKRLVKELNAVSQFAGGKLVMYLFEFGLESSQGITVEEKLAELAQNEPQRKLRLRAAQDLLQDQTGIYFDFEPSGRLLVGRDPLQGVQGLQSRIARGETLTDAESHIVRIAQESNARLKALGEAGILSWSSVKPDDEPQRYIVLNDVNVERLEVLPAPLIPKPSHSVSHAQKHRGQPMLATPTGKGR